MTEKVSVSINSGNTPTLILTKRAQEIAFEAMQRRLDPSRPKGNRIPALRVAVRPGGCSGFSYEYVHEFEIDKENDEVLQFGELTVVIDKDSKEKLRGSELDYVEGLQGSGFQMKNPSVTRTCGCGNSFS